MENISIWYQMDDFEEGKKVDGENPVSNILILDPKNKQSELIRYKEGKERNLDYFSTSENSYKKIQEDVGEISESAKFSDKKHPFNLTKVIKDEYSENELIETITDPFSETFVLTGLAGNMKINDKKYDGFFLEGNSFFFTDYFTDKQQIIQDPADTESVKVIDNTK